MFRKVRLDDKSEYECLSVVYSMAAMLEAHIAGRCVTACIGCEQGDVEHWDDLIIEHTDGSLEHCQIKSQNTDFDTKPCKKPDGNPGLSPLDNALASLATRYEKNAGHREDSRRFTLELITTVGVKKGVETRHLEELARHIADGNAEAHLLADRAKKDKCTEQLYEWLTTWCGFSDWDHIIAALRRLSIKSIGTSANLRQQIKDKLSPYFSDADAALEKILAFARAKTSDISTTRPSILLQELKGLLAPECMTWTQYKLELGANSWFISGTTGTVNGIAEPPQTVVQAMWRLGNRARILRIPKPLTLEPYTPSLSATLMRLALHLQGASQAAVSNPDAWREIARVETGNTFGAQPDDIYAATWVECSPVLGQDVGRTLDNPADVSTEACQLTQAMNEVTWEAVKVAVATRMQQISESSYRASIQTLWTSWRKELEELPQEYGDLLAAMLYPDGECIDGVRRLRLGPQTVQLLACGLEMALIFAFAIGGPSTSWKSLMKGGDTRAIALQMWSGPIPGNRAVNSIGYHGIEALTGQAAKPKYILLTGTATSPTELTGTSMAEDDSASTSMSQPALPIVFTRQLAVERLIGQGTAKHAEALFRTRIDNHSASMLSAISAYRKGG